MRFFSALIRSMEEMPLSIGQIAIGVFVVLLIATVQQLWLARIALIDGEGYWLYFLDLLPNNMIFWGVVWICAWGTGKDILRVARVFFVGYPVILFAQPIIARLLYGVTFSFYEFGGVQEMYQSFITLFGITPTIGITQTMRWQIASIVLLVTFFMWMHTRRFLRTFFVSFCVYSMLFGVAAFASLWAIAFGPQGLSTTDVQVAQLFMTALPLFGVEKARTASFHIHSILAFSLVQSIGIAALIYWRFPTLRQQWHIAWAQAQPLWALSWVLLGMMTVFGFYAQTPLFVTTSHFALPALLCIAIGIVVHALAWWLIAQKEMSHVRSGLLYSVGGSVIIGIVHAPIAIILLANTAWHWFMALPPYRMMTRCWGAAFLFVTDAIVLWLCGMLLLRPFHSFFLQTRIVAAFICSVGLLALMRQCMAWWRGGVFSVRRRAFFAGCVFLWAIAIVMLLNLFALQEFIVGIASILSLCGLYLPEQISDRKRKA